MDRISAKVLQNEKRAVFVIPKVHCFLLRNSTLLSILCCKNRKVVSITATRDNK